MAQTDSWRKAKSLFSTTLSTGISTGTGETITPNSVTGLPTDTEITLTIDRVDSGGTATPTKMERITGTVSGGNIINYTRGIDGSTEQAHSAGAVIEYIWNADDWNDAVDSFLAQHNQAGTHSDITASTIELASGVSATYILDEDDMASDSATSLATQQSIKKYVDDSGFSGSIQDTDHAGSSSTTSATLANITGADVTVTLTETSNILLVATVQAYANLVALTGAVDYSIQLHDGTSVIGGIVGTSLNVGNTRVVLSLNHAIQKDAGEHTFTIQHKSNNGATSCTAEAINFSALVIPSA